MESPSGILRALDNSEICVIAQDRSGLRLMLIITVKYSIIFYMLYGNL